MDGCNHESCPIGFKLSQHITETELKCKTAGTFNESLEKKVEAYYDLLLKHTDEEMKKFYTIHSSIEDIKEEIVTGKQRDQLLDQKFSFWSKIATVIASGVVAILAGITVMVWEVAKHFIGIGG